MKIRNKMQVLDEIRFIEEVYNSKIIEQTINKCHNNIINTLEESQSYLEFYINITKRTGETWFFIRQLLEILELASNLIPES